MIAFIIWRLDFYLNSEFQQLVSDFRLSIPNLQQSYLHGRNGKGPSLRYFSLDHYFQIFCLCEVQNNQITISLFTLKFSTKVLIASRNDKGELAFRGSFPSDAFSFLLCSRNVDRLNLWTSRWAKTDIHPVDLIRDSSMVVRQKFKFNGVPEIPLFSSRVPK